MREFNHDRLPSMHEILRACSARFKVTTAQIRGERVHASIAYVRHVAMFLCRVDARRSYPEIGRFFNKDHTTVMAADRKIFARREQGDRQLEDDLAAIRRLLEMALGLAQDFGCADCRALAAENKSLRDELAVVTQERDAMRVRFGCG